MRQRNKPRAHGQAEQRGNTEDQRDIELHLLPLVMAMMDERDYGDLLIGGIENVEIHIVDSDPAWASQFQEHATRIRAALGDIMLRIEHIGSTSVPGLPSKPIIDIILVVTNCADEDAYLRLLEAAGYQLRVRETDHRMLRTLSRDVHIHVYSSGSSEIERLLVFRDRLRQDASDRELYAQTKRELAARDWRDMNAYADAKTQVIDGIIARSRAAKA